MTPIPRPCPGKHNNKNPDHPVGVFKFQFIVRMHEMQNAKCKMQNEGIAYGDD